MTQGLRIGRSGSTEGHVHRVPAGEIKAFALTVAPLGWHFTDGAALSRSQYPELFAFCGTRFNTGGEGETEFRIPLVADHGLLKFAIKL